MNLPIEPTENMIAVGGDLEISVRRIHSCKNCKHENRFKTSAESPCLTCVRRVSYGTECNWVSK